MENCVALGLDKFDLLLEAVLSLVRVCIMVLVYIVGTLELESLNASKSIGISY